MIIDYRDLKNINLDLRESVEPIDIILPPLPMSLSVYILNNDTKTKVQLEYISDAHYKVNNPFLLNSGSHNFIGIDEPDKTIIVWKSSDFNIIVQKNVKVDGVYFTPSIDSNGNLSWSNNGGLDNPPTINLNSNTDIYVGSNEPTENQVVWFNPESASQD